MTEESVPIPKDVTKIRIFCVACERQASILWSSDPVNDMRRMLHVRCHNEERLIVLPMFAMRRVRMTGAAVVDFMWSGLEDAGDDTQLQAIFDEEENHILKSAELQQAIASVLASRMNGRQQ